MEDSELKSSSSVELLNAKLRKSLLFFDVPESACPIVYHPIYNISFCGLEKCHPFDAGKWGRIYEILREAHAITDVVEPREASEDDLLIVHTKRYLRSLKFSVVVATVMEVFFVSCIPNCLVQRKALRPFRFQVGGSVIAAKLAVDRGWAINLGGGFHHCSADRGAGFCAYADITLCVRFLQLSGLIRSAMIVDLDAHQGNGHERDFTDDESVFILDVYNGDIYPRDTIAKKGISRMEELQSYTKDPAYLAIVERSLMESLEEFQPDIIVYNAGTDILEGDPLGCLSISEQGVIKRDEIVFRIASERKIPIVMLTSGGYQRCNARIIANSILNLKERSYIKLP